MPGEHDACEYLWGSERINHPASSHKITASPIGFNGSQFVKELVFPLIFPLVREVFWVFTFICFLYFPLTQERFCEVLFFLCFEILLYISPALPLRGLGFLKESDLG